MPVLPGWVQKLMKKRSQIEDAIGMRIGQPLGCGHFGCVFAGPDPWSIKLTRDPTEGDMWAAIATWEEENSYGTDGMAKIKEVVRLKPDIKWRGKAWPVHVIVREEIQPLWADGIKLSDYSRQALGLPPGTGYMMLGGFGGQMRRLRDEDPRAYANAVELDLLLKGLEKFKEAAALYHHAQTLKRPSNRARRMDVAEEQMYSAINMMSGPVGGAIGETLAVLKDDGIVLRDVHWNNIGWRVHSEVGDQVELPQTLIIFDPGHTPTGERDIRTETLKNAGRF